MTNTVIMDDSGRTADFPKHFTECDHTGELDMYTDCKPFGDEYVTEAWCMECGAEAVDIVLDIDGDTGEYGQVISWICGIASATWIAPQYAE